MAHVVVFNYLFIWKKMFEQENLQGWNISHIVSSWHRGLGKANAAIPPSSTEWGTLEKPREKGTGLGVEESL